MRSMVGRGKTLAKQTLLLQLCVTVLVSLLLLMIFNAYATALSYFIGASISMIPSMIFAFFAFRFAGASSKELVMKSFSQGSKIKLAMTIILFVLAYQLTLLQPVFMLIGFAITTAIHTIGIILMSKRKTTISN